MTMSATTAISLTTLEETTYYLTKNQKRILNNLKEKIYERENYEEDTMAKKKLIQRQYQMKPT